MDVTPMLPAEIDRFRLLQLIAWWRRKKVGLGQKELAKEAAVHQSSISHMERLGSAVVLPSDSERVRTAKGRIRVGRDKFIRIFSWGLKFCRADIDALLWLYDQKEITEREIKYLRSYEHDAKPQKYTEKDYNELRQRVLALLRQAREYMLHESREVSGSHTADVKIIFEGTKEEYLESEQEILRVEELPGQRMMLMTHPSFLAYPESAIQSGELIEPWVTGAIRGKVRDVDLKRHAAFLQHLELYGERAIHRKANLEAYLTDEYTSHRTPEKRRAQIENLIKLLQTYPYYQIGISQETPEFEFTIKSVVEVIMRGTSHGERDDFQDRESTVLVPRYIHWTDKLSVLSYYLTFETYWDAIPEEDRTKETVIEKLRKLISASQPTL